MLGGSDILKAIFDWLRREPGPDDQWCAIVKGPCWRHRCAQYRHVIGKHPQSGKDIEEYDCVFNWVPILTIENTQQTIQLAAAIESERNELIKEGVRNRQTLASAALLIGGSDHAKLINDAAPARPALGDDLASTRKPLDEGAGDAVNGDS